MKLKRGMLEGIQNQLETKMKISAKTVSLGNKKIKFTALDDIAEVKVGLQTGDNPYYLYKDKDALGSYKIYKRKR